MRKLVFFVLCSTCALSLFAQATAANAEVVGIWRDDRQKVTIQYNADGTFTMWDDKEEKRQLTEEEKREWGDASTEKFSGTYTVEKGKIHMTALYNGKSWRMLPSSYRKIDEDTLRMGGHDFQRVSSSHE